MVRRVKPGHERGDTILEFAVTLPLLMVLLFTLGAAVWTFWAQAAADAAAARASREAAFNRGGEVVLPGAGVDSFGASAAFLTGERTAGSLGPAAVGQLPDLRLVVLQVLGGQDFRFGPVRSTYSFSAGTASRAWLFYGGPPDPWE